MGFYAPNRSQKNIGQHCAEKTKNDAATERRAKRLRLLKFYGVQTARERRKAERRIELNERRLEKYIKIRAQQQNLQQTAKQPQNRGDSQPVRQPALG